METLNHSSAWHRVRGIALVTAVVVFFYATLQLVLGSHANAWRFVAIGSLYACFCLMQQRLFAPVHPLRTRDAGKKRALVD